MLICNYCKTYNRSQAVFCRDCGTSLNQISTLKQEISLNEIFKDIVGLVEAKNQIEILLKSIELHRRRESISKQNIWKDINILISGPSGSGKSLIVEIIANLLFEMSVTSSKRIVKLPEVADLLNSPDYIAHVVRDLYSEARNGILHIDDTNGTVFSTSTSENLKVLVKSIFHCISEHHYQVITIISTTESKTEIIFKENEMMLAHFPCTIFTHDYKSHELLNIFKMLCIKTKNVLGWNVEKKVSQHFSNYCMNNNGNLLNANYVKYYFSQIIKNRDARLTREYHVSEKNLFIIDVIDLPFDDSEILSSETILEELNSFIGNEELKKHIKDIYNLQLLEKERNKIKNVQSSYFPHFVFSGNPGTGKTTIARLFGKIFYSLGLLSKNSVIEVNGNDLVASYLGQTGHLVNKIIDNAIGGVLFIDEAYTLVPTHDSDSYKKEAINTLISRIENDREKFICIVAGYPKEMEKLLNSNQGLKSRFTNTLNFKDFTASELALIFKKVVKDSNMEFEKFKDDILISYFQNLLNSSDQYFGNARTVRNIFDKAKLKHAERIIRNNEKKDLFLIKTEDLP